MSSFPGVAVVGVGREPPDAVCALGAGACPGGVAADDGGSGVLGVNSIGFFRPPKHERQPKVG